MFTFDPNRTFTRDEAVSALSLRREVIDALIASNALHEPLTARELEAFFRDGLLRLYHAVARGEQPVIEEAPEIARHFEDFHTLTRDKRDHRKAPRHTSKRQVAGTFRDVNFTLLEVSATGLRIRHDATLRPGDEARVTFTVPKPTPRTYAMRARVAWTTIAQHSDGASYCLTGLQVTANVDHLQKALEQIRTFDAPHETPPELVGISDDDVASIIRAYRDCHGTPESIWDALEHKVAITAITSVVSWLRQTRSAAA